MHRSMRRISVSSLAALALGLVLPVCASAQPVVRRSIFDPAAGPNGYTIQFPPELSGATVLMPITGGSFDLETDATLGTSRLLTWHQDISPIQIFGMSTGPIAVTIDESQPSTGTFDAETQSFSVTATFLISFDDTELSQIGFLSPVALEGTEAGTIYGVGSIGTIQMFLQGQGTFAGGTFGYTCRTTARFEYDIPATHSQIGDVNRDRSLDISDSVAILRSLYLGVQAPCASASDVNQDGNVDISDAVYLLNFLYLGGPATPADAVDCTSAV